jgi:nucleoside-diphosphate-sugar epimerase
MAWRPLVHIEDISRAFLAVLEAPREVVHNESFNVGRTEENYLIRDVAETVRDVVPGCEVTYTDGASADARNYRVECGKIARALPAFQPQWTVRRGVEQLYGAFRSKGLSMDDFLGPRYQRLKRVRQLLDGGELNAALRWRKALLTASGV